MDCVEALSRTAETGKLGSSLRVPSGYGFPWNSIAVTVCSSMLVFRISGLSEVHKYSEDDDTFYDLFTGYWIFWDF